MRNEIKSSRYVLIYLIAGFLWIVLSDFVLYDILVVTSDEFFKGELIKGLLFVIVTSAFLYIILQYFSKKLKEKNEELIKASDLYKTLIEQSMEGVFRFEASRPVPTSLPVVKQIELYYKCTSLAECNNAFAKMYGYSKSEDVIGFELNAFIPQNNSGSIDYLKEFVKNGYKIIDLETQEEDKFGNKKYFLNNLLGIVEDGVLKRIWGAKRDITKIKEVEEAKIESEELYKTVIESMAEGLLITDINDKILYANSRMSEITGYKIGEMIGKKSYELFFEPKERQILLSRNRLRLTDKYNDYETQMKRKDGSKLWIRISGTPYKNSKGKIIGTLGVINDITQFRLAQKMLKESEEKYRSVVEQVNEIIYQTDSKGKLIFVNRYWTQLTGYKINECIGRSIVNFIFAEDREKISSEIISIVANKKESARTQARLNTFSGGLKWIEINAHLIREDNRIFGISGTITDIHDRKLAEEELIKAKERAEESDRLKSVFLAQVSHEVRTPLNVILNYNSIINEYLQDKLPGELDVELNAVENGGKRLLRTIDLILNMSLIQTGNYKVNPEKIGLNDLLLKLVNEFYSLAREKKIELDFIHGSEETFILGDEYTLAQTFQNLIDNAIKYTNKGRVEIKIYRNGSSRVNVDVSDTGIGMSPEYIPNLFKPFSQEEQGYSRKFEGNGLGLALTKKYIELNNADITVKSKKGQGSTFTVVLNQAN